MLVVCFPNAFFASCVTFYFDLGVGKESQAAERKNIFYTAKQIL